MEQSGGSTNGATAMRRDVLTMEPWGETLVWYARAVADMKARPKPLDEPTSWQYQATVHGHIPESEKSEFWNQCQHGTSFFLPWHRGYIAAFEQIVRATVVKLGGPSSWALPYWNYSSKTDANARCLPRAFREPDLPPPDGGPNPLFVARRHAKANAGEPVGPETDVSLAALEQLVFEGPGQGGSTGFGGPATGFQHQPGRFGALEVRPHNAIHMDVGGLMESPSTAALDPIFWLHHSNIDRLWEVWIRQPGRLNPTREGWLTFPFKLHDGEGKAFQFVPGEVLDTKGAWLRYEYDDVSIPPPPPAARAVAVAAKEESVPVPPKPSEAPPEMVGATAQPLTLGAEAGETELPISEPAGPIARTLAAEPSSVHVYLNVENVTSESPAMNYDVYLNVPEDGDPQARPDLLAGVLAPFGSERATDPEDPHAGEGLHFTFDVTQIVAEQRANGEWNPAKARVAFVPRAGEPDPVPLHVGRVSLYYHS